MTKWRLVVKTLPWVLIVLGVMYAEGYVEGATADVSPHPILELRERFEANLSLQA